MTWLLLRMVCQATLIAWLSSKSVRFLLQTLGSALTTLFLFLEIPSNTIILDTAAFERQLHRIGRSPAILDPATLLARRPGHTLSLGNLLRALGIDISHFVFHNSGNDAFAALSALQLLLEPSTQSKRLRKRASSLAMPPAPRRISSNGSNVDVVQHQAPSPAELMVITSGVVEILPDEHNSPNKGDDPINSPKKATIPPNSPPKGDVPVRGTAGKGKARRGRGGAQGKQGSQQQQGQHVEDAMKELFLE